MTKAIAFIVVVLLTVAATPTTPPPTIATPNIEFEHYKLPNGLDVILHVDRKLPVVHVNEWFHVGSKNERRGRTGFAHLFEHMMLQGSKNAPDRYFVYAERAGANLFAHGVDATTDQDRTNYFITVPAGKLEYVLWLESDRVATLADAIDETKFENQIDVVKNERRQSQENQPYGRAFDAIGRNAFPAEHPYSWPVLGSPEDLSAASVEDVVAFFRAYYTPNNLSLTIAGDFDIAEAKRLVEKYFGPIPPGPPLERMKRSIPKLSGETIVEFQDRVPQDRVYITWPSAEYFSEDDAPLDVASTILTDGLSSRLQKALLYDKEMASSVESFNGSGEIAGTFIIIATARPGQSLQAIEEEITNQIARLAKEGPTPAEVERARKKLVYQFISGLERIGGFGGKADILNRYNTYLGDPGKFDEDIDRYRKVTPAAIRRALGRWIDTRNRVLVRFHSDTSSPANTTIDRTAVPAVGADRPFMAPRVETATLENGLTVYVVERHDLPKVDVAFGTRAGATADPEGSSGLANMVVRVLDRGTTSRTSLQIDDALGTLGAQFSKSADRELARLNLSVLKSDLGNAMAIVSDVVLHPTFPQSEFAREQKLQLDALSQQAREARALASRVRNILAFGRTHPYGRPREGSPASVSAITRDDVVRFHSERWKPASSALVFIGDVTLEEATAIARKYFGAWSGGAAAAIAIPAPQPMPSGRIYVVDRPGAAQTVVAQIVGAPPQRSDDRFAVTVADAVWGGGFGTRLNLNLREQKGYSYGAYSSPTFYSEAGVWIAQGAVQTDKTKESVVEFLAELKGMAGDRPISETELTNARLTFVRGYAQSFETYRSVADAILARWTTGTPMSDLQRVPEEVSRMSLAKANAAARKYIVPEQQKLLLVGDRAVIEEGLRDLEIGEIVVLDADGNVVK